MGAFDARWITAEVKAAMKTQGTSSDIDEGGCTRVVGRVQDLLRRRSTPGVFASVTKYDVQTGRG